MGADFQVRCKKLKINGLLYENQGLRINIPKNIEGAKVLDTLMEIPGCQAARN